uniref:SMODS and SLOG-associating 2TM effector domain-containing protein n=1 Tax=Candidatus Kentrum sp. FM TaxID=2126340 RepID=A0A450S3T9_9GAMM|nr:MAG: hypothetical protein BECKFM1743C_GA0114222_1000814 [Candidatus Kentron sp. FM]VFJ46378.1 MAG: hypothetical protein BECKFM1743A_GA0114220_1003610 [Candidatus Kentron sp. FM]VFK07510.1 MAG: hypothetical protein BECKFM1743B_GA0114221_100428 [Candidatus Kentron sp. FM]
MDTIIKKERPATSAITADTDSAEMREIKVQIEVAFNYMEKRAYALQTFHKMIMFLVAIASGGLVAIAIDIVKPEATIAASLFIGTASLLGLFDSFFDLSDRAQKYKMTASRLHFLERKIRSGNAAYTEIKNEHDEILVSMDFKWITALYAETCNDVTKGDHLYKIPFLARMLKNILNIPFKPGYAKR